MSINPTLQTPTFLGNNDFTWWLGTVENSDDKDAKLGRVKVNILGFHKTDETPENLPWALVLQPTTNPAVSGVGNAANSLKPGSFVMGFFLDYPDCQQPVVLGTFYSQIKKAIEPDTQNARDYISSVNRRTSNIQATETGQPDESENVLPTATKSTTKTVNEGVSVSESVAAKSSPASASNPSGKIGSVPIADGKDGPLKVISEQIKMCIEELGNIFKTGKIYDPNSKNSVLTKSVSIEQQYIPVSNVELFPPKGKIKIGSEIIGYNGKNEYSLVLVKRGMQSTIPKQYPAGTKVTYIKKTDTPIEIVGKYTDKVVDVKSAVNRCISIIRNLVWYIVNEIKSYLMKEVTKYLNLLGLSSISPIPFFVKTITEVIIQVLKTISCTLDESLVDALMGGIEGFINEFVENLADQLIRQTEQYINFAEQCINDVFGSIFELTSIATQIADAVSGITDLISSVSNIGNVGALFDSAGMVNAAALGNIGNIVSFILNLLGIGCNRTTESPLQITWDTCDLTQNNCNPFNFVVTGGISGRWNPEYSKIFVQKSEAGHTIVMDDTPHNNRLVIEAGGSKTGFHILDNGDIEITNSSNKTEVTFGKQRVTIKGDVYLDVGGNYHLKVGGNYHLEVDGQFNLYANRESKITFGGEHETIYKNDSKLSAANGLAVAGSKIGISASGQLDIYSPTLSTFCTEENHLCTGSYNIYAMFENKYIGLNKFCLVGGNKISLRAGTNTDLGTGISNSFQAATESVWKGGLYNESIMGANNTTRLGIDNDATVGATTKSKLSSSLENITGAAFTTTTGLCTKNIQGVMLDISAALAFRQGPAIFDT